jgi:peptidoglycan hydrolase-like protein with peptidoglycan-binding domain
MPVNKTLCIAVAIIAAELGVLPARAEPPQPSPAHVDSAQDAAKSAFEALQEADRKAIQEGLIWTGDYKGIADGRFGKGTHDAIAAFAQRAKLPGDGTLDDKGRAALAAAALHARTNVHFSVVADERTGIKIGVPLKLLPKIGLTKNGTRYASADNNSAVEISLAPESEATLEQKFDALRGESAQRKVTYKVSRPEFIVVVGEAAGTIFYSRFARGERNGEKMLAGYSLTYSATSKATFDMIAIAMANSFEPFANKPVLADAEHNMTLAAPTKPYLAAKGLVIASGLVLTSLPPSGCRDVQIGTHEVKIAQHEKANGLALLEAAHVTRPAVPWQSSGLKTDMPVVVLAYATKLTASAGGPADDLVAAPGMLHLGNAGLRVSAAAQGVNAGTIVFDRSGAVVGLVAAEAGPDKRVGDVTPIASRPMINVATLADFLGPKRPRDTDKPAAAASERSLGDIVAENGAAVVAVYCVP